MSKYATKDYLKTELKNELKRYATKEEFADIVGRATDTMVKEFLTVIELIGEMSGKLDKKTTEQDDILEHNQRQIDKLNNKVFPTF